MVNNLPVNAEDVSSIPELGRSLEVGNGNSPVFFPGESHGQRSLAGYSPCGHKRIRKDLATKQQPQQFVIVSVHFHSFLDT